MTTDRSILRNWYYSMPLTWRKLVRKIYYLPKDLLNSRKSFVPPDGENFIGPGDFEKIGLEFFGYLRQYTNIHPNAHILEVGCGMGRMAAPMTSYFNNGSYHGFDIVEEGIQWCKEKVAPNHPRFHFQIVDIYNKLYRPNGKLKAEAFSFPYQNEQFDIVLLTSVFTHMPANEMEHYLSEICRVLKKKGQAFITVFLIDEETKELQSLGKSFLQFIFPLENCYTINEQIPESNIAFDWEFFKNAFQRHSFTLEAKLNGSWSGRKDFVSFQDIIILRK